MCVSMVVTGGDSDAAIRPTLGAGGCSAENNTAGSGNRNIESIKDIKMSKELRVCYDIDGKIASDGRIEENTAS